jgi:hypothetical protein
MAGQTAAPRAVARQGVAWQQGTPTGHGMTRGMEGPARLRRHGGRGGHDSRRWSGQEGDREMRENRREGEEKRERRGLSGPTCS